MPFTTFLNIVSWYQEIATPVCALARNDTALGWYKNLENDRVYAYRRTNKCLMKQR